MISEQSAHLAPLSVDFLTWLWRYTYLLLLISMLWHRKAIFKSKGDKLCSSAEGRIWTRGPRHPITSRLNARWQTDWANEDQAINLNSAARPYDQRAISPLGPTVSWLFLIGPPQMDNTKMLSKYVRTHQHWLNRLFNRWSNLHLVPLVFPGCSVYNCSKTGAYVVFRNNIQTMVRALPFIQQFAELK